MSRTTPGRPSRAANGAAVIEHIYEEIEHAISVALSAWDLAAAAPLLEKAQAAAERILAERIPAERGAKPRVPPPSAA